LGAFALSCCTASAASADAGLAYTSGGKLPPVVWSADADGSHPQKLGLGLFPQLSPDGAMVAASLGGPRGHALAVYSTTGGAARQYFQFKQVNATALGWSPDSRYVAVALLDGRSLKVGRAGLVVIDTTTGTARKVVSGVVQGASFAPTGPDRLAYGLSASQLFQSTTNLFSVPAAGGSPTQLTHDGHSYYPVWGKLGIAFDAVTLAHHKSPAYSISLLKGGHTTAITHQQPTLLQDGLQPMSVSADGTRLLASFVGEDTDFAWTVDLVTHRTHRLMVSGGPPTGWGISRDGISVLVDVGGFENPASDGTVESLPFAGGAPTVLVKHADEPSWNR
jgi:hypothetical protein